MISSTISENERFARIGDRAFLAWYLMLGKSDRQGRLPGKLLELIAVCWPLRAMVRPEWGEAGTEEIVAELHDCGGIIAYEASGVRAIQIHRFHEHQTLRWGVDAKGHRKGAAPSRFPNGFGVADATEEADEWYLMATSPSDVFGRCEPVTGSDPEGTLTTTSPSRDDASPSRAGPIPRTAGYEVEVGRGSRKKEVEDEDERGADAPSSAAPTARDASDLANLLLRAWPTMFLQVNARLGAAGEKPVPPPALGIHEATALAREVPCLAWFPTERVLIDELRRICSCFDQKGWPIRKASSVVKLVGQVFEDVAEADQEPVIWQKQEKTQNGRPGASVAKLTEGIGKEVPS